MTIKKAGTILVNLENATVALVCTNNRYSFPKGHVEKNETIEQCAIRETIEETGHECHLINKLSERILTYTTPSGKTIEAHYYVAIDDGVSSKKINPHDKELTIWENINDVEKMLSYRNLKDMWRASINDVKNLLG